MTNVTADDLAAIKLNETWLHKNLRLALEIQSRDGVTEIADGIWRLGNMRRDPVLLARSVMRVATQPRIFDRVRVAGREIMVIAPQERGLRERPFPVGSRGYRSRSALTSTAAASCLSSRRHPKA